MKAWLYEEWSGLWRGCIAAFALTFAWIALDNLFLEPRPDYSLLASGVMAGFWAGYVYAIRTKVTQ
jgi:hypothetical protein